MKKILGIIILGLILNGCASGAPSNYSGYKDYWKQQGFNYAGMACPISSIEKGNTPEDLDGDVIVARGSDFSGGVSECNRIKRCY